MITLTLVLVTLILLAGVAFYSQTTLFAKPTGTYQTKIVDKVERQTVIYTGVFIPMKVYHVLTAENREIKVDKRQYARVRLMDNVTITGYSNGLHRLEL